MLAWTLPKADRMKLDADDALPPDLRALLYDQEHTSELAIEYGMEWPVVRAKELLPHAERLKLRSASILKQAIAAHDHKVTKNRKRLRRRKPR